MVGGAKAAKETTGNRKLTKMNLNGSGPYSSPRKTVEPGSLNHMVLAFESRKKEKGCGIKPPRPGMCQKYLCMEAQRAHCVTLWRCSLDCLVDPNISDKPESSDTCWGELLSRSRRSPRANRTKGVGVLTGPLTSDVENEEFGVHPVGSQSCFGPVPTHHAPFPVFWNGNVYPMPLYVGVYDQLFDFDLTGDCTHEIAWNSEGTLSFRRLNKF